ncbi:uncharacterized protein BJ171DRAFT_216106 [Polychytrium aggregatum]|uniref:uncharacterized protein n=1 Tax=Polychytrium aggregatum TaxID=110093 RepID=UPI0022FE4A51|nr:uncharacterized protein BJ171DRAFT_216106 [Polychytrium aggregatum]KAI9199317.1 hypothetical protein BJ171DRAFT_216106 [Polychytrium aggregatum]
MSIPNHPYQNPYGPLDPAEVPNDLHRRPAAPLPSNPLSFGQLPFRRDDQHPPAFYPGDSPPSALLPLRARDFFGPGRPGDSSLPPLLPPPRISERPASYARDRAPASSLSAYSIDAFAHRPLPVNESSTLRRLPPPLADPITSGSGRPPSLHQHPQKYSLEPYPPPHQPPYQQTYHHGSSDLRPSSSALPPGLSSYTLAAARPSGPAAGDGLHSSPPASWSTLAQYAAPAPRSGREPLHPINLADPRDAFEAPSQHRAAGPGIFSALQPPQTSASYSGTRSDWTDVYPDPHSQSQLRNQAISQVPPSWSTKSLAHDSARPPAPHPSTVSDPQSDVRPTLAHAARTSPPDAAYLGAEVPGSASTKSDPPGGVESAPRKNKFEEALLCRGCNQKKGQAFLFGKASGAFVSHSIISQFDCVSCHQASNGTAPSQAVPQDLNQDHGLDDPDRSGQPLASRLIGASKRKRKYEHDQDQYFTCDVCKKAFGFGRVAIEEESLRSKKNAVGIELVCDPCTTKYKFCSNCGGGGHWRTGKWRPAELFGYARRTCRLPHDRIGEVNEIEYVTWALPLTANVQSQTITGLSSDQDFMQWQRQLLLEQMHGIWTDVGLLRLGQSRVMEHFESFSTFEKITERLDAMWIRDILPLLTQRKDNQKGYLTIAFIPELISRKQRYRAEKAQREKTLSAMASSSSSSLASSSSAGSLLLGPSSSSSSSSAVGLSAANKGRKSHDKIIGGFCTGNWRQTEGTFQLTHRVDKRLEDPGGMMVPLLQRMMKQFMRDEEQARHEAAGGKIFPVCKYAWFVSRKSSDLTSAIFGDDTESDAQSGVATEHSGDMQPICSEPEVPGLPSQATAQPTTTTTTSTTTVAALASDNDDAGQSQGPSELPRSTPSSLKKPVPQRIASGAPAAHATMPPTANESNLAKTFVDPYRIQLRRQGFLPLQEYRLRHPEADDYTFEDDSYPPEVLHNFDIFVVEIAKFVDYLDSAVSMMV